MKTYYYNVDNKGRITGLSEKQWLGEDQPSIELETNVGFVLGFYGVRNGQLYEIGFDQSYLDEQTLLERQHRIVRLKNMLEETDWKVIVNAELYQAGLPLKYPDLHTERQAWRDEINELEK